MPNWLNPVSGNWTDGALWDTGSEPGPTDSAVVAVAGSYTITLNTSITVGSLTLSDTGAFLSANGSNDTDVISGDLSNAGVFGIDADGYTTEGGTSFTVGGTLTNTGQLYLGSSSTTLSADVSLTVGQLAGAGSVNLYGSPATIQAVLDDLSAAPTTLLGNTYLDGNALLEYASGSIGTIASNVTLTLNGAAAHIADKTDTTTNSALTQLSEIDGTLLAINGASITADGDLTNAGFLGVDSDNYTSEGGSSVTVIGILNNTGSLTIGPGTNGLSASASLTVEDLTGAGAVSLYGSYATTNPPQALLDVQSAAPTTLLGNTYLDGNSLLEYASGSIGTIASNVTLTLNGTTAHIADKNATATNSALTGLTELDGSLLAVNGASVTVDGDLANAGGLGVDSDSYTSEGGSSVTITGTLNNTGHLVVGPGTNSLSSTATLTVGDLAGAGAVSLYGSYATTNPPQALLVDQSAAPTTLLGNTYLDGNALLEYASGSIGTIASSVTLTLNGTAAHIADKNATATNSALTGLTELDGSLLAVNGASVTVDGDLANAGGLGVDSDSYTSEGGSSVTVTGTLDNTGHLIIGPGNNSLSSTATLTVGDLTGAGAVSLYGSYATTNPPQALLVDQSAAPTTLLGNTYLDGNALLEYASGSIGTIASDVTLTLNGTAAHIADKNATTTNSALTGLTENDGTLLAIYGASITVDGDLTNTGGLGVDSDSYTSEGGSSVTVTGTLDNTGHLIIGPGNNSLSSTATLTVGDLTGTGGVYLYGSNAATNPPQALLVDQSAAPTTLAGTTFLDGNALLEYASGSIGTIASNVTLTLSGTAAHIADKSATTTNSALTGLTENDGTLLAVYGASITVDGDLKNAGGLGVDSDSYTSEGGSSVTVTGTLDNTGHLVIGPGNNSLSSNATLTVGDLAGAGAVYLYGSNAATNPPQALLDDLSAAPTTLAGSTYLSGNALLEYASGSIGTIASNVTLTLNGTAAHIADKNATTTNSALTGLTENDGTLLAVYGASITVDGDLANTGGLGVDSDSYTSEGGSSVTVTGPLNNTGHLVIGPGNNSLSSTATLTVGDLTGTGGVYLYGSYAATNPPQALLDDLSAAPTTLAGTTYLGGNALLEYASGSVGTIGSNITVTLNGPGAHIADKDATTTNSALTGLTEIDGTLLAINGASITVDGDLKNAGYLGLDSDSYTIEGGSTVTVTGTLDNTNQLAIGPATGGLSANTTLAVGQLTGTGSVTIVGNYNATTNRPQAVLDDLSAAPTTLVSNTYLNGNALLEFSSGQIGTIANGTSLSLLGTDAFVVDAGSIDSNSALTGLAVNDGTFKLQYGNSVTIDGGFTNAGFLGLDSDGYTSTEGGSSLAIDGTLANTGGIDIGPSPGSLAASDTLTADTLVNTGTISLFGSTTGTATMRFLAGASNSGSLLIGADAALIVANASTFTQAAGTATIAASGTLDAATIAITGGELAVNGGTITTNAVDFTANSGTLAVGGGSALPTIGGFGAGDTLELLGATASQVTPTYSTSTGTTSLAITLSDNSVLTYTLAGDFENAPFAIDNTGGNALITTSQTVSVAAEPLFEVNGSPLAPAGAPNTFVLNLGSLATGAAGLTVDLSVLNAATAPADQLGGTFTVGGASVFANSGLGNFTDISAGSANTAPTITLGSATLGQFGETIVLNPVDESTGGNTTILPSETLIVSGSVYTPPIPVIEPIVPTSIFWGDVHVVDFDGLSYNFQAAGEFVLAKSTIAGDSFQVQARLEPYSAGSSVSVMTMIAAAVGTDRVTFDVARADTVWVNGAAVSLTSGGAAMQLNGGTLQEVSPGTYLVSWNSGESMTVQNGGSLLDVSLALSALDGAGSVEGLAGSDSGAAKDFALADGTVLAQPLTSAQLYGEFADAWRVTQGTSLLDYSPGQNTTTFTDVNFPGDAVALANLPSTVTAAAAQQANTAQITDPTIAQQAELDYAATGNASFLTSAQFAQSAGVVPTMATITPSAAPTPAVGVEPAVSDVTETQGGPTDVSFIIYLTGAKTQDTTVDWAVTAPASYLGAAAFGGTLPSGSAVIGAGQTSTTVTVTVPASAFGTEPNDELQLTVTAPGGDPVFAPSAQTLLVNTSPEPGPPAGIGIAELAGGGTFTQTGAATTVNLGTIDQNTGPVTVQFGIENTGAAGADQLIGTFGTTASTAYTLTGFSAFGPLVSGQTDASLQAALSTDSIGTFTETVTLTPKDTNNTGYVAALADQTITITGTIANLPAPTIASSGTLETIAAMPMVIGPLTITDPNSDALTVTLTDTVGILGAVASGKTVVRGGGTNTLILSGDAADVNATLASVTYSSSTVGTDTIDVQVQDSERASATAAIAVTTDPVPATAAVFNEPAYDLILLDTKNALGGLSLSDPLAAATGEVLTVEFNDPFGTFGATGSGGATVTGAGTSTLDITGTVQQINDYLDDALDFTPLGLLNFLGTKVPGPAGTILKSTSGEDLVSAAGGPEGKYFQVGVEDASFALNQILGALPGGTPPSFIAHVMRLAKIIFGKDPAIVLQDGTIYNVEAEGEFVLATTTQPGDSFDVQIRLQPVPGSTTSSELTQVAAAIGTDRITFGVGRTSFVQLNGAAEPTAIGKLITLSGGQLEQIDATTYQLTWDTGEVLTVDDGGTYMTLQVAPGPNNPAGDIVGLANNTDAVGNEFTLPDGTVLSQPLSTADLLNNFVDAWRVPQQYSLFDYTNGQTTANFTDATFGQSQLTLADLPSSVVALAATAVANAGITDPGVAQAIEMDYLASGGDPNVVVNDANEFGTITTAQANVTESGTPPAALGILASQPSVQLSTSTPANVVFDVYLTSATDADTAVTYAVVAAGTGYVGAAAFGGNLPSGIIDIPASKTSAEITLPLLAGVLGSMPSENLEVQISGPSGTGVFNDTAQVQLTQPIAGPPPVPTLTDLTNLGTFTELNATTYTLDLGAVQYAEPLPEISFALTNAAVAGSDNLGGSFTVQSVEGFSVGGATLPQPIGAGQSYDGLTVAPVYVKFGANTETITFTPQDSNSTGYSKSLSPITLTVTDDIVPPTMVYSYAYGDVHIITYNGLIYNFQAVGEFTLAKSRVDGDSFDIQLRLQQWTPGAVVSVITQAAVSVGTDRVTFDITRPDFVQVNGVVANISAASPVLSLDGGSLVWLTSTELQVKWATGEEATFTDQGSYINVADGIPLAAPDTVGGLQGEDAGQANDLQLSDGTVLAQPVDPTELYGPYADSWRVTTATSLFDYLPGQTTQTFTDKDFPADVVPLSAVPTALVTQAAAMVAAAGITDPGIAQDAEEDYIATGDASFISAGAAVNAKVPETTPVTITPKLPPVPEVLVAATPVGVVAAASGTTAVTFDVYLTGTATTDTIVDYNILDEGTGSLGAAAFGGTLPSGSVTIAQGQTQAAFTVQVAQGALGTEPSETVTARISAPGGNVLYAEDSTATVANPDKVPGTAPAASFILLQGPGTLTVDGTHYTLDLGTLVQGQTADLDQIALLNTATAPADNLTGSFSAPLGSGFTVIGNSLPSPIAAGGQYDGLYVGAQTSTPGSYSETLTLTPVDSNASGYSAKLTPITLTVTDEVGAPAQAALNSPGTIVFPNAHVGATDSQAVSISNTAAPPAAGLTVGTETGGAATVTGAITDLAAGTTDTKDLSVGLDTSTAGLLSGVVDLTPESVGSAGAEAPIPGDPSIDLFGGVYRTATASAAPVQAVFHVGDTGTTTLDITNTAAADGLSENLIASIVGAAGDFSTTPDATIGEIAAGASDTKSLAVDFSTQQAGTLTGTVTLDLVSDGGTGANSIDGLGKTTLTPITVPLSIVVDRPAVPELEKLAGTGTLTAGKAPDSYVLNLGTVTQNASPVTVSLAALNAAIAQADDLDGSYTISGDPYFTNTGFGDFSAVGAGDTSGTDTVSLGTGKTGGFSETIVLHPTDSNSSGYSQPLPDETLTVIGTVAAPTGTAIGDVHLTTFDGLYYNFQADGDFTLAQSTAPGDSFRVQIQTAPFPAINATSIVTEAAAQVGGNVVTFGMGSDTVAINGVADTALSMAHPTQLLDGGELQMIAANEYELSWDTGESMTITKGTQYLNVTAKLGSQDTPGSVQGLLGTDTGQANDFSLPDGTVLKQPLTSAQLLGTFADAWTVAPDQSLLGGTVPVSSALGVPAGMTFLSATAPGQILTGSLQETGGGATTLLSTLANLSGDTVTNFAPHDLIDVTDISSALAAVAYQGNATDGTLSIAAGNASAALHFVGGLSGGTFHVASDQHGGTLLSYS